jgi:predicted MPP superfamily phosphohydrolase
MLYRRESKPPVDVIESADDPFTVFRTSLSRRRWLKRAAAVTVAAGGSLAGYAFGFEPHWVEVVHQEMTLQNLSPDLVGKRLIQISDLHIGPIVADHYLWDAFRTIEALEPDILVITGDVMHFRDSSQLEQASSVLRMLPHGRLATLVVTGNHDFGARWSKTGVADKLCRRLRQLGITPLRNEYADISSLRILGVDDVWSPVGDLDSTLSHYADSRPTIALCHNPDAVDDPVWQNFRGWILSGHTHGGQVWLPGMRPVVPVKNLSYVAGHVQLAEHRHLYVNRALGYLKRVRFCVRPEITVFELAAA